MIKLRIKKVIFKNCYGEEIAFGKKFPLYVEKINTFGITGRFTSDSIIGSPGQYTAFLGDSGKTITAEFAYWNRLRDDMTLRKIERVFTPLKTGLLTVFDEDDMIYTIEAYPNSMPVFQRSGSVLKWSVNFQADYPYWEKGYEDIVTEVPQNTVTAVYNPGMIPVSPVLILPQSRPSRTISKTSGQAASFSVDSSPDNVLTINTRDFTVVDENGNNKNNLLYASAALDEFFLEPGVNYLYCIQSSFTVKFKELAAGVM